MNAHLQDVIPIEYAENRETGWFEYRRFIDYMLQKNGLLEIVDNVNTTSPVVVAVTFDGGKISRFFSHVTGGFKQVDPRCRNPKTGALLFSVSGNENVQSHVHCFPLKVCFAKDTKDLYRVEFEDFFAFLKAYELEKAGRIKFGFPQDMSSIWKTTGRGGTAKVKTFPCYCCTVTSDTLIAPQPKEKCFRGNRCRQPKCYHRPMLNEATMDGWKECKDELALEFPFLSSIGPIVPNSKILLTTLIEWRDENNPYDINFQPANEHEARAFKELLLSELQMRQLPTDGTVREKRARLKSALEAQEQFKLLTKLVGSTDMASAFITIEAAIPCILHAGNRLGEKIFMMLLLEAWRCCTNNAQKKELISVVEHFVNTGAFGTAESRAQWKLPVDKEGNVDTVTFLAWRVRKNFNMLSDLADNLFRQANNTHRIEDWQRMLASYMQVLSIAFQHEDFSDEDIEEFQDAVDAWFYQYVELLGLEGK